jgi:hypothetical protein
MKAAAIKSFIWKSPAVVLSRLQILKKSPHLDESGVEVKIAMGRRLKGEIGAAASTEAECDLDSGYFKDGRQWLTAPQARTKS